MNRQFAFIGGERMLKGGLHCHTTRSDGTLTPEEVIRLHAKNGYDFLAITDHRIYNYENYAPETGLTIIPGTEMDAIKDQDNSQDIGMVYHSVCIGPPRGEGNGFANNERIEGAHVSTQEEFQRAILDKAHAANNLTFYCHPQWSKTPVRSFERLQGIFAMEIWNSTCAMNCGMDTDNGMLWDELLMQGRRIWGLATDDGHRLAEYGNGWVCVRAHNDVSSILNALRQGAFYASCGPEILDFYADGDAVVLECSPCRSISFIVGAHRPGAPVFRNEGGLISRAVWKPKQMRGYVRAVVVDDIGQRAWSNPIFFD